MSSVVAEIEAGVRTLSREDKAELLRALIAELDGPANADAERAWLEEAKRRHRRDRGRQGEAGPRRTCF